MSKVLIAIPFINCKEWTLQALRSIKSKHDLVILLIDNASTDGFLETLTEAIPELSKDWDEERVNVVYDRNETALSVAQSWNKALLVGNKYADYILVCNNDIIFHPETIDRLVEFIEMTGYTLVTPTNQRDYKIDPMKLDEVPFTMQDIRERVTWRDEGPDFSCFLVKGDFIHEFGLFDENFWPAYFEDNDAHMRLRLLGKTCARSLTIPYYHYGSRTLAENPAIKSLSHNTTFVKNRAYFVKKWGAEPEQAMDGQGYSLPFQNIIKEIDIMYWPGIEKYFPEEHANDSI